MKLAGSVNRRQSLQALRLGGLSFTRPGAFAQALVETPAQTLGPYYPDRRPSAAPASKEIAPGAGSNLPPPGGELVW